MLKFWKRNSKGKPYLYEEKPENKDVSFETKDFDTAEIPILRDFSAL